MQVINKKMCVVVILLLVIIEACTLFLMYKSYNNQNNKLDEVNLNINNTNMFAIMLEQDDGTYKEDTSSAWPTDGYTYNASMSGCIDQHGNKLDGVLTYDSTNNIASVNTTDTSYCYLYFSKPKSAPETILEGEENITFTLEGGLYRYQGTQEEVDNNYICFGTNDKDTCTNDTNTYMYRIIGIAQDNKMKIIKKETLEMYDDSLECLHSIYTYGYGNLSWVETDIYQQLNGINHSQNLTFVSGNLYPYMSTDSEWYNMIDLVNWKYGRIGTNNIYQNYNAISIYEIENRFTDSINAKIGLMYIYDYYYAYKDGNPGSYSNAKTSWIHLDNNDTEFSTCGVEVYSMEFLITQDNYDDDENLTYQFSISHDGYIQVLTEGLIRPVFYLKSDIDITGEGTIDNPYIIN